MRMKNESVAKFDENMISMNNDIISIFWNHHRHRTKSCRMVRNSVCPSVRLYIFLLSTQGSEGQLEWSVGLREGSEGLPKGSGGLPESKGLPHGFEGLSEGPGVALRLSPQVYRNTPFCSSSKNVGIQYMHAFSLG